MSCTNNPRSILAGSGITSTPSTGTGSNIITIATADTIDGAATATITVPFSALTFVYAGVEWKIL